MGTLQENLLVCETLEHRVGLLLSGLFGDLLGNGAVRVYGKNCFAFDSVAGITRIMWRWRDSKKFNPNVFTLRSRHRKASRTELQEVLTGALDFYLYLSVDNNMIVDWVLINLNIFRHTVNTNPERFFTVEQHNENLFGRWDGTSYYEFKIPDFHHELCLHRHRTNKEHDSYIYGVTNEQARTR